MTLSVIFLAPVVWCMISLEALGAFDFENALSFLLCSQVNVTRVSRHRFRGDCGERGEKSWGRCTAARSRFHAAVMHIFVLFVSFLCVLGLELRTLCMPGKGFPTESHPALGVSYSLS